MSSDFTLPQFENAKAWAWREAGKLLKRLDLKDAGSVVTFSTGYGPSGLPHLGTLGEVTRTTFVRNAFALLAGAPTRLLAVSDDMDGLRSVPSNVPNAEMLQSSLGLPLSRVPNPFDSDHPSFAHHNNARLRAFLDEFGVDYDFISSAEHYQGGKFDNGMRRVLQLHDQIRDIVAPTLGKERRATYSPFLPISQKTGRVLQALVLETDPATDSIVYLDQDQQQVTTKVTGGHCKLQWKADWGMRWYVLGVDYEMAGKDLISSHDLSSKICRLLGGKPPTGMIYEHFLDEEGQKISKSRGNGLEFDTWLRYAPRPSLSYMLFQKPQSAKRLSLATIPQTLQAYYRDAARLEKQLQAKDAAALENPVWHLQLAAKTSSTAADASTNASKGIEAPMVPAIGFDMLINLLSACQTDDQDVIWQYITRYIPGASKESDPQLADLLRHASNYYLDNVKPKQKFASPDARATEALKSLLSSLEQAGDDLDADALQTMLFDVAKQHGYEPISSFFTTLYQCLFGADHGPRLGQFIAIYGTKQMCELIKSKLV